VAVEGVGGSSRGQTGEREAVQERKAREGAKKVDLGDEAEQVIV